MFNQQGGFGEIAGREDSVRVLGFQVGELCAEVFVAGLIVSNFNYTACTGQFFKSFFEEFCQTYRVVIRHFLYDGNFFCAFLEGIVSHNGTLERIDKAGAEVIVVTFGNLGVGAAGADSRNFAVFHDVTGCHSQGRTVGTQDYFNLVFFN